MLGIIVELIISWLLLWFICKKHLSVLGFKPTTHRVIFLIAGLLIAALFCTLYQIMSTAFVNNGWVLNKQITNKTILENSKWTLISVIYEELIFRGALLYIAIKKLGIIKACLLSAVGFGIYHWFTFNVLGNPLMMLITFAMTAIIGFSWAFAFAKTGSMYVPVGLHAGWNLVSTVIFSNNPFQQAIFIRINDVQLQGIPSLLVFLFQVFALPLFTMWYLIRNTGKKFVVEK